MAQQQGTNNNANAAFVAPLPTWGLNTAQPFLQGQLNGFGHQNLPFVAPPTVITAITPGPDDRAPNHALQIAPQPEARRASTKRGRSNDADYRHERSTAVHDVQIWHNPDRHDIGGLRAGMHLWLHFAHNGIMIEEHMVLVGITTINNVAHLQFDRYDRNHIRTLFGEYSAVGGLVQDLAARCWTNVNLDARRMMYRWWHVYDHADYAVNPVNHGQYLGNLEYFRKNFCLRNGWAPK